MKTRPSWDNYFIKVATVVAERSQDNDTQVGCVLVDQNHRIIATGYNGHPQGVDGLPSTRPEKYFYTIHAEINAIAHATRDLKNTTCYCTHFPCADCTKALLAAGITRVVWKSLTNSQKIQGTKEVEDFLSLCHVDITQITEDL